MNTSLIEVTGFLFDGMVIPIEKPLVHHCRESLSSLLNKYCIDNCERVIRAGSLISVNDISLRVNSVGCKGLEVVEL